MADFNKFNTFLLDALIDALETIKNFSYISTSGTTTVNPAQLVILEEKILVLKTIRDKFKNDYESFLKELPKILEQINKE